MVEPSGRLRGLEIEGRPELTGPGAGAAVDPEFTSLPSQWPTASKSSGPMPYSYGVQTAPVKGTGPDLAQPVYLYSLITSLPFPHNSRSFKHQ